MEFDILEPLKEYSLEYQEKFADATQRAFDRLVEQSGIDVEQNRASVEEYENSAGMRALADAKVKNSFTKRNIAVAFLLIGIVAAVVGALNLAGILSFEPIIGIVLICAGAVLAVSMIAVIFAKLNKEIRIRQEVAADLADEEEQAKQVCYAQMASLNALFTEGMTAKLVHEVLPIIRLDRNFSAQKSAAIARAYGFEENDDETESITGILSGDIGKNPFFTERKFVHTMGTKTYTGSLTVEWEELESDSDGNVYKVTKSETLSASIERPYPEYYNFTQTYYFNDAAGELSFSRSPQVSQGDSDKKIDRMVSKGERKLERKSRKALDAGGTFTKMGNSEFDVLFAATDRDNEQQFRLLFTPMAQRNMVALIKDKTYYGDDFYFTKIGKIHAIATTHGQEWAFGDMPERYISHSVDESRETFCTYNEEFFRALYFELAPILSIPLYQQTPPSQEYDLNAACERHVSEREASVLANLFDDSVFDPQNAATSTILKCTYTGSMGQADTYRVTAHSYRADTRIHYEPVLCRDGNYYNVPIEWIEYTPISKDTDLSVADLDSYGQDVANADVRDSVGDILSSCGRERITYKNMVAVVGTNTAGLDIALRGISKQ